MATAFNRNIITKGDIARLSKATSGDEVPATLDVNPPAGYAAAAAAPSGGSPVLEYLPPLPPALVPSEDDYLTKLLKYVPLEVLGAYLFVAGVIDSNVTDKRDHALWLGGLLVGILVLTIPYDIRVLNVVRAKQIVVSVIGLSVYVFAVGTISGTPALSFQSLGSSWRLSSSATYPRQKIRATNQGCSPHHRAQFGMTAHRVRCAGPAPSLTERLRCSSRGASIGPLDSTTGWSSEPPG
jgi:hypothetical protein